jgi:hypothetical protein
MPSTSSDWPEARPIRIVLDENLPRPLRRAFGPEDQVVTVQDLGLAGISNGDLLAKLEGEHDVFVTADQNLRYQQNLAGWTLAIVELPTNRWPALNALSNEVAVVTGEPWSFDRCRRICRVVSLITLGATAC